MGLYFWICVLSHKAPGSTAAFRKFYEYFQRILEPEGALGKCLNFLLVAGVRVVCGGLAFRFRSWADLRFHVTSERESKERDLKIVSPSSILQVRKQVQR